MKYGLIKDSKVVYLGQVNNGVWQGQIFYNDDKTRKTAEQIIVEKGLKEIIVPANFDGNATHYNYIEQDDKIVLAGLKSEVATKKERQADVSRISTLRTELASEDYKVIKRMESQLNGVDLPYNLAELTASRNAKREEINILENKWRL